MAASLQREIVDFTVTFESYGSLLVDDAVARQRDEVPDFLAADEDTGVVRDAAAVGVATALAAIRAPHHLPARSPAASAREAQVAARAEAPLAALRRSYRIGHAVFQDHFLVHGERIGCSLAALQAVSANTFAYLDWLLPLAEREWWAERERVEAVPGRARLEQVRRVLDGLAAPELPHPLDAWHVAVVGRGAGDLALDLVVRTPQGELWGWLLARDDEDVAARLRAGAAPGTFGVGSAGFGAAGFAASHREARLACRLGARRDARVTRHADVALEALPFAGPDAARAFAAAELGALAAEDDRTTRLRDTLGSHFAAHGHTPATAAALGISARTVTARLRRVEELLGRPLGVRRTELETALRLHRLFTLAGSSR